MAYGDAPQTVARDAVRLLVGDVSTSTSSEFLSDGSYDYFLSVTPNNYVAASLAASSLSALFTTAAVSGTGSNGYMRKKVGDLELEKGDAQQYAAHYKTLSVEMRRMSALGISPYAGGQTVSGKRSVEQDTDRVRPAFKVGGYDNPGTGLTSTST